MKVFMMIFMLLMICSNAYAHQIKAPAGKTLKVHWAVLQAKEGKMSEMAGISSRTVAKFTPNEAGSYALYGAVAKENPDLMRILEIYEDEDAYEVHRSSEGFQAFIEERKPILESLKILPVDGIVLEQKAEGNGKIVVMTLIEAKPDKLDEVKAVLTREMKRAVAEIPGVLGMFATAEKGDRKNFIHTLEIYADDEAKENYEYQISDELLLSRKTFENFPVNIKLSNKGLHFSNLDEFKATDPEFSEFFGNFAGIEVPAQTKLDSRTRYMAILATLLGCQGREEFRAILPEALDGGVLPSEVKEIIYQGTAYLGIGRTRPFLTITNEVFTEKNISLPLPPAATTNPENRVELGNKAQVDIFGDRMKDFQNVGPEETRHINRWLAGNCFGDYYTRKGLSLREREMITFCYIAAQGGCEPQLTSHAKGNMNMGNDKAFLIDVVSQCLPYIGYPRSLNAIACINKAAE